MENSKKDFNSMPSKEVIENTAKALEGNGIKVILVKNKEEAKEAVLNLIPEKSEVMTYTSTTNDEIGLTEILNDSKKYSSVRSILYSDDNGISKQDKKKKGAAPEFGIGSVHSITEDGKLLIASATGSQLPAYAYGAGKIIWVAGVNKITKNINEAFERLEKHVFPLENERAKKAYGVGSFIAKTLVINKEFDKDRAVLVLVNEKLGF